MNPTLAGVVLSTIRAAVSVPVPVPVPVPPPSEPEPVTNVDWRNREYTTDCAGLVPDAPFDVVMRDGKGGKSTSGNWNRFEVSVQAVAIDDLTGDGKKEAAVLLWCLPQPSNYFVQEVQVFARGPKLLAKLPSLINPIDPYGLPPEYQSNELSIEKGTLVTGVKYYGSDDSHASGPSIHRTLRWHWSGRGFSY
jgi:hypothetical protein